MLSAAAKGDVWHCCGAHTGPVKVVFDFVDQVPASWGSTNWAAASAAPRVNAMRDKGAILGEAS
jgi:hypothetical protein